MRLLDEKQDATQQEVTWEDQQSINAFSKLNMKLSDVEEHFATCEQRVETLEDALNELEMYELNAEEDEDGNEAVVDYRMGDCFVALPITTGKERLVAEVEEARLMCEKQQTLMDTISKEMDALKTRLYAKFGNSINLERTVEWIKIH